jgi:predicted transposase YbfD/YdcC
MEEFAKNTMTKEKNNRIAARMTSKVQVHDIPSFQREHQDNRKGRRDITPENLKNIKKMADF